MVPEEVMVGPTEPSELVQLSQLVWGQKLQRLESRTNSTGNIGSEPPCERRKAEAKYNFSLLPWE